MKIVIRQKYLGLETRKQIHHIQYACTVYDSKPINDWKVEEKNNILPYKFYSV